MASKKAKRRGRKKTSRARGRTASCPVHVKTRRLAGGPWIQREGKLGGPGYSHKSERERHRLLNCSLERFGYRSTLGSLTVLLRNRDISKKVSGVIKKDLLWLKSRT